MDVQLLPYAHIPRISERIAPTTQVSTRTHSENIYIYFFCCCRTPFSGLYYSSSYKPSSSLAVPSWNPATALPFPLSFTAPFTSPSASTP